MLLLVTLWGPPSRKLAHFLLLCCSTNRLWPADKIMVRIICIKSYFKYFHRTIVNIVLPISFTYVLGAPKNHLIEMVLLSTHNICFGSEIRNLMFVS